MSVGHRGSLKQAVELVSALDLRRCPIAVRACRGLAHLSGIVLHPLGALVAAASTWSHTVKLEGHVNVQPPMKQLEQDYRRLGAS